jgi:hypothetical protein
MVGRWVARRTADVQAKSVTLMGKPPPLAV